MHVLQMINIQADTVLREITCIVELYMHDLTPNNCNDANYVVLQANMTVYGTLNLFNLYNNNLIMLICGSLL